MHGTPIIVKKITHDVQNISPIQVSVQHIVEDMGIELVNRNLGLYA